MFILGTASVLAMIPNDQIDLIAPIPQLLAIGFGPLGAAAAIVPFTLSSMLAIRFAQASVNFAGSTRLPMVAGWDSLLPAWFTRLSEKYKTPVNSILFVGAATLLLSTLGLDRGREAGGVSTAVELRRNLLRTDLSGDVCRPTLRPEAREGAATLVGEAVRVVRIADDGSLYVSLSVLPIIPVGSRTVFAMKIAGLIVVTNLIGVALYVFRARRTAR